MKNSTILGAIKLVLRNAGTSMPPRAIFDEIIKNNYYRFGELKIHSELCVANCVRIVKVLIFQQQLLINSLNIYLMAHLYCWDLNQTGIPQKILGKTSASSNMILFEALKNSTSKYNTHIKTQILE